MELLSLCFSFLTHSYDLTQYGEYKEFVLQVDNSFCQTRMQQDFVIFPKMHLNGTTIIVSPDLKGKKQFVNEEMTKDLENVKPGIQSILVIPRKLLSFFTGA